MHTNSSVVNAPVADVFAYVTDHRNWTRLLLGVREVVPRGHGDTCEGAQFDCVAVVGPITIPGRLTVTALEFDRLFIYRTTSARGDSVSHFEFAAMTQSTCRITTTVTHELRGTIARRTLTPVLNTLSANYHGHIDKKLRHGLDLATG